PGGTSVQRSRDGGCSWTTTFDGSTTARPGPWANYQITSVVLPDAGHPVKHQYLYALMSDVTLNLWAPVDQTFVAVSADDGATWTIPDPAPSPIGKGAPPCYGARIAA